MNIKNLLGAIFTNLGACGFLIFGIWGFIISLKVLIDTLGFWGGAAGIIIFPATLAIAPWYALFAHGNWGPVLVVYGGAVISSFFFMSGNYLAGIDL